MEGIIHIDLLRHGETEGGPRFRGSTDDPLTDIGWDQMRSATNGEPHWDRVISSPLKRCAGFAREFAQQHSLPLTLEQRLSEIHFGAWEGRSAAELMEEDPDALVHFWADPEQHTPPDGEPLTQFQARVLTAWNSIIHAHTGERVLVVTHGGVIRVLLCQVQQRPVGRLLEIEVKHGALYSLRASIDAQENPSTKLIKQL